MQPGCTAAMAILAALSIVSRGEALPDPFIESAERIKHSVAPVVCLNVRGAEATLVSREGTAFFTSAEGRFVTAGHVIEHMQADESRCPAWAVVLPVDGWQPGAADESLSWFRFEQKNCALDKHLDVAACRLPSSVSRVKIRPAPIDVEGSLPGDGTQVALVGFPLNARDPMTFRASISAFRPSWRDGQSVAELVLDRAGWPGSSGSPVFLADGRVIGIVIGGRTEDGIGMTTVRPVGTVRHLMAPETPLRDQ